MKTSSALSLIALASVVAFLTGEWTSGGNDGTHSGPREINTRTSPSRAVPRATVAGNAGLSEKARSGHGGISPEKAGHLTPEQRVALMKKAALLADAGRQSEILCGLISAMTRDELAETTKVLLEVQGRGNSWSQAVWNSLWTQWGKVDPVACLALSANGQGLNTTEDYRCLMAGWLAMDSQTALAWANQGGHNPQDAAAAAFAITRSARGDIQKMESAILALSGDGLTQQACLHDFFDLAISSGEKPTPSMVYDRLSPSLRAAAWPVVMERLAYADPQEAAAWLGNHAEDPGRDYGATHRLVTGMSRRDPAGTAEWAVGLPFPDSNNPESLKQHPAVVAINDWMDHDPAGAKAWLETQPADSPWLLRIRTRLDRIKTQ